MFSIKNFIDSGFTFRSLIHFEFIFVYGVRKCSHFILLHVAVQFSQHHLLKRLVFAPLYSLASFVKRQTSLLAQTVKCLPTIWDTLVQSMGWEDPLEKEMATHPSTLAWKIPWTEEPCRLQSMGSQRVGHD